MSLFYYIYCLQTKRMKKFQLPQLKFVFQVCLLHHPVPEEPGDGVRGEALLRQYLRGVLSELQAVRSTGGEIFPAFSLAPSLFRSKLS